MIDETTEIIEHSTVDALAEAYAEACVEIRRGFDLLKSAEDRLAAVYVPHFREFRVLDRHASTRDEVGPEGASDSIARIKRSAWRVIVERLKIRPMLSEKRWEEFDKQLRHGDIPEITAESIEEMVSGFAGNLDRYFAEALDEVFSFLRPRGWASAYKTNSEFEIGRKVILAGVVEQQGDRWRVNYYRQQNLRSLDNVFHLLDGKKAPEGSYYGPLCDAIMASYGAGETEYFKFECFKNRNLHLVFRRSDLVAQLNAAAGGKRLRTAA